jgi:acetamidase/formamidase
MKRPKEDPIAMAASALDGKVAALEGEATPILETPKSASFMAVNDTLTALMALVDGADFAPSEESFAAFHRVCKGLNETLSAWQEFKNKDVAALNSLLEKNKLAALPDSPYLAADEACGN